MAKKLTDSIGSMGYDFLCESNSNQIFPLFPQKLIDHLSQQFSFYVREK
jgi:threonine aldolase